MSQESRNTPRNEARLRAETYAKAARMMERPKRRGTGVYPCGCCEAIGDSIPPELEGADLESPFAALFKPKGSGLYWWGDCMCFRPETQDERVLALCFMAAITENP